jgi:hypothetical protein
LNKDTNCAIEGICHGCNVVWRLKTLKMGQTSSPETLVSYRKMTPDKNPKVSSYNKDTKCLKNLVTSLVLVQSFQGAGIRHRFFNLFRRSARIYPHMCQPRSQNISFVSSNIYLKTWCCIFHIYIVFQTIKT